MTVLAFLISTTGRWIRAAVGLLLITVAAALGGGWWALAAVGAPLVLVGLRDVCLLAPFAGRPVRGKEFRADLAR